MTPQIGEHYEGWRKPSTIHRTGEMPVKRQDHECVYGMHDVLIRIHLPGYPRPGSELLMVPTLQRWARSSTFQRAISIGFCAIRSKPGDTAGRTVCSWEAHHGRGLSPLSSVCRHGQVSRLCIEMWGGHGNVIILHGKSVSFFEFIATSPSPFPMFAQLSPCLPASCLPCRQEHACGGTMSGTLHACVRVCA